MDMSNVDTDAIIPKQFLKSVERVGFGQFLFDAWRCLDQGEPGMDCTKRPLNPKFVLNQERYSGATILLARENFGCGSSREHAPWALAEYGFRAILAPSFADIFYNNSLKNGLLPVKLEPGQVEELMKLTESEPESKIEVDLEKQTVVSPEGREYSFSIDPFRKSCLLQGLDDLGYLLQMIPMVEKYEERVFTLSLM